MINIMYAKIPGNQEKSKDLLKYFEDIIDKLSKSRKNTFNLLADFFFRYKVVNPSQLFIAKKYGYTRETINRAIEELESLGLIIKTPQKRKMSGYTCSYSLVSWITKEMCKRMKHVLKAFDYFPLKFLCSSTDLFNKNKNVTLVNFNYKYNLFYNPRIPGPRIRKTSNGEVIITSREEEAMKSMDNVVTTEKINEIDELLGLTMHGKIKLRAFEDEVLQQALNSFMMANTKNMTNKFDFLVSKAIEFSYAKRIPVSWKRYYTLRDAYQISPDDRNFMAEKTQRVEKSTFKNKQKTEPRAMSPERQRMGEESDKKLADYKERQKIADQVYVDEIRQRVQSGFIEEKAAKILIDLRLSNSREY